MAHMLQILLTAYTHLSPGLPLVEGEDDSEEVHCASSLFVEVSQHTDSLTGYNVLLVPVVLPD